MKKKILIVLLEWIRVLSHFENKILFERERGREINWPVSFSFIL